MGFINHLGCLHGCWQLSLVFYISLFLFFPIHFLCFLHLIFDSGIYLISHTLSPVCFRLFCRPRCLVCVSSVLIPAILIALTFFFQILYPLFYKTLVKVSADSSHSLLVPYLCLLGRPLSLSMFNLIPRSVHLCPFPLSSSIPLAAFTALRSNYNFKPSVLLTKLLIADPTTSVAPCLLSRARNSPGTKDLQPTPAMLGRAEIMLRVSESHRAAPGSVPVPDTPGDAVSGCFSKKQSQRLEQMKPKCVGCG